MCYLSAMMRQQTRWCAPVTNHVSFDSISIEMFLDLCNIRGNVLKILVSVLTIYLRALERRKRRGWKKENVLSGWERWKLCSLERSVVVRCSISCPWPPSSQRKCPDYTRSRAGKGDCVLVSQARVLRNSKQYFVSSCFQGKGLFTCRVWQRTTQSYFVPNPIFFLPFQWYRAPKWWAQYPKVEVVPVILQS